MDRIAQCQCGSLRAITSGEPIRVSLCHCVTCQQRTGSVFSCNCYFRRSSVRTEGKATLYARSAESGREVRNYFCPSCGTTLYWEAEASPEVYGLAVGAFNDPEFPPPTFSSWEESMHRWVNVPGVEHHLKSTGTVPR